MKIGSVPYLNARPLVDWLERAPRADVELHYAVPSKLVEQVLSGELDVVMASTFPILVYPELKLLPGLGVTVAGPALSVRLFSRKPIENIATLALDSSSRSSSVLAQIVLADRYGIEPLVISCPPNLDLMLEKADAGMLIGDIGMQVEQPDLLTLDLGAEWWALTGLPFYFAGWVAKDASVLEKASPLLFEACQHGLARLTDIAMEEAGRLDLPVTLCHRYLAEVMRYQTGEAEEAGLKEFRRRAANLGLLNP